MNKEQFKLQINSKYHLKELDLHIPQDLYELHSFNFLYVVSCPTKEWLTHQDLSEEQNFSVNKKLSIFYSLSENSLMLSAVDQLRAKKKSFFKQGRISFLSSRLRVKRFRQISLLVKMIIFAFKQRQKFNAILIYNIQFPTALIGIFLKLFFKKSLFIDFEDDYLTIESSPLKRALTKYIIKVSDGAILINSNMANYFDSNQKTFIYQGDYSYIPSGIILRHRMKFLFGGSLDEIRGADLVFDVSKALSQVVEHDIYITGQGPLESIFFEKRQNIKYMGFMQEEEYKKLLEEIDCFLVLQKPDHPFSKGSFPSKIIDYSKSGKPIMILSLNKEI